MLSSRILLTSRWSRAACVRTLNGSIVARSAVASRVPNMDTTFTGKTVEQLQQWLGKHQVDTAGYGHGTSKTVEELLEEVSKRESILEVEDGSAIRIVHVLTLHVLNEDNQVLFEEEQIKPDGRSRHRNVALSEKLVADETWQAGVHRAIQEELGSVLPQGYQVTVFDETYQQECHTSTSMSYPNLPAKYIFHRVCVNVTGLPDGPFSTSEDRPGGKLITRWMWRYKDEVPCDIFAST